MTATTKPPALAAIAQAHGPRSVLAVLCAVPPAALALGLMLTSPGGKPHGVTGQRAPHRPSELRDGSDSGPWFVNVRR